MLCQSASCHEKHEQPPREGPSPNRFRTRTPEKFDNNLDSFYYEVGKLTGSRNLIQNEIDPRFTRVADRLARVETCIVMNPGKVLSSDAQRGFRKVKMSRASRLPKILLKDENSSEKDRHDFESLSAEEKDKHLQRRRKWKGVCLARQPENAIGNLKHWYRDVHKEYQTVQHSRQSAVVLCPI